MVSFFLPMKLQVKVTMAVGLYFVLRTFLTKQKISGQNYVQAFLIGSSFLLFLFAVPFTPPEFRKTLLRLCEHRVSFLLMPLAFAMMAPRFRNVLVNELVFFVFGCFVTCVAANADFIYHYLKSGKEILTHVQYRAITHLFTDIHPTYMGMYLCFAICILLLSPGFATRAGIIIKNTLLVFLFIFLLALGPKMPIIALGIIFIHFAYTQRARLHQLRFLFAGLLAALVAAWLFIPFVSQRVKEVLQGLGGGSENAGNSVSVRKLIWNMDTGLLKQYWLTGTGPGRMLHVLQEHYFFYALRHPLGVAYYDPHNEYFYHWLCFGITGIVVLVAILIAHFRAALQSRNYLYLYLLIILATVFFTESVLSLARGVLFYSLLSSLFYFAARQKESDV
jgi:O-antigen ligase